MSQEVLAKPDLRLDLYKLPTCGIAVINQVNLNLRVIPVEEEPRSPSRVEMPLCRLCDYEVLEDGAAHLAVSQLLGGLDAQQVT